MHLNIALDTVFSGLTAVGTIGACVISLILAYGKYKHKLDCVFVWGSPNDYQPTLLIKNLCSLTIVIRKIDVFYGKKRIASFNFLDDYSLGKYAIIPAESESRISFDSDKFNFGSLEISESGTASKKRLLKIVVSTSSSKKFISKQKYSPDEIVGLLFGNGLFSND